MSSSSLPSRYKPYPGYKDSGVEAFGEIPALWEVRPVRAHFRLSRGRVISHEEIHENPGKYPVYSSQTEGEGVMGFLGSFDFDGAYLTWTTDGAKAGTVFRRDGQFNCTNVCGTLKPSQPDSIDLSFANFALNLATGFFVRHDINPKLMNGVMAGIRFPIPSKKEQRAIAEFLDRETAKIDNLIARKERLIELLEEKRSALITRAVTRGLDPNAPLRDSGIEWLGQIPADWQVQRLKFILDRPLEYGASETSEHTNSDWPRFIRITDLNEDGSLREESFRSLPPEVAEYYLVSAGDLLFARSGATVGKSFLYRGDTGDKACFAGYLIRAAINRKKARPEFVWFFTRSDKYRSWLSQVAIQATIQNISAERYANLWVPMPSLSEQDAILENIRKGMTILDRLVATVTNAIKRLKEYRSALITAAVTGKIDVRDEVKAAA
jgi:type I restriction enzyme S subunit